MLSDTMPATNLCRTIQVNKLSYRSATFLALAPLKAVLHKNVVFKLRHTSKSATRNLFFAINIGLETGDSPFYRTVSEPPAR